jgi:hypothetical protein
LVRDWTDPRDGTTWEIELRLPASPAAPNSWVWKAPRTTEEPGAVLRFCRRASATTLSKVYYVAGTLTDDPSSISDERLMALLDRAKSRE